MTKKKKTAFMPGAVKGVRKSNKMTVTRTVPQGGTPTNSGLKTGGPKNPRRFFGKKGVNAKVKAHDRRQMRKHHVGL